MGKSNSQQFSYAAGAVSPLLRARPDIARYQSGAETVENMVVRAQGPLARRVGTKYIGPSMVAASNCRLVPFEFSSAESYLIEFCGVSSGGATCLIRPRDDSGPLFEAGTLTISSVADFGDGTAEVTFSGAHGFSGTTYITITGSSVSAYNGEWRATVTGGAKVHLLQSVFSATATGSAQEQVWFTGPYADSAIHELSFAQSADTLFICHPNYKPRKLTRSSSTSWTLAEFTTVDGPYLDYNRDNIRLTVTDIDDAASVTANGDMAGGANAFADPADVNDWVEFIDQDQIMIGRITAVGSASAATVNISDKMLLGIDPAVRVRGRLTPKGTDGSATRPPSRQVPPFVMPNRFWNGYDLFRPGTNVPGIGPATSPPTTPDPEAIDPNATVVVSGANLIASHSNVFSKSDVGKHVRATNIAIGAANAWYLITAFTNHFTVAATALTMKTYDTTTADEAVTLDVNSRTITATLGASGSLFAATDVGRHIRMNFQGRWVFAKITAYTSATEVDIQMFDSFPRSVNSANRLANDGSTDVFRMGAWYGSDGTGNYPCHVTFHEQRLVFAGSPAEPQTIWFSRPQDFDKMSPSEMDGAVTDDSAINVTLASNKVNGITWLQSSKVLLVGTIGGEWQGRAASSMAEPMTPTNIVFTEETTHGSIDNCQPVKVGPAVLFLQRSGQKLRELSYNFELDGWMSRDLTIASEHILRIGTQGIRMAYQNEPYSIVWVILSNGALAGLTYQREQEVVGWHYHQLGGSGIVESIAATPTVAATENTVYMVVRRTINGGTERYIEKLVTDDFDDATDFRFVDSHVSEDVGVGSGGTTWAALSHLIGTTVAVLVEGTYVGTYVVDSDGEVDIAPNVVAGVMVAGLPYTSKFKSLPVQGGSPYGSADMSKKRVHKLFLRLYNAINAKVGSGESALQTKTFNSGNLYTGDVELNTNLDYGSDGVFHLQVSDPYPMTLLGHVAQLHANE